MNLLFLSVHTSSGDTLHRYPWGNSAITSSKCSLPKQCHPHQLLCHPHSHKINQPVAHVIEQLHISELILHTGGSLCPTLPETLSSRPCILQLKHHSSASCPTSPHIIQKCHSALTRHGAPPGSGCSEACSVLHHLGFHHPEGHRLPL